MKLLARNIGMSVVICAGIIGCVNSGSENYFVSLGELGNSRVMSKYGAGVYYFYRSNYRFSGKNYEQEKKDFFSEVYRKGGDICVGGFTLIRETLSYYSESGNVSVLVKCNEEITNE